MAWVRHHDKYDGAVVDAKETYQQPKDFGFVLRLSTQYELVLHAIKGGLRLLIRPSSYSLYVYFKPT